MNDYTPLFEDLAKSGNQTDDFWENTDCAYRFLKEHNPDYAQAEAISATHTSSLFENLAPEQTEIIEVHYYYITDYMNLQSRFYYTYGLMLALFELLNPPLAQERFDALDETRRSYLLSPATAVARRKAEKSYQKLSALFAPLGRQTQLDQALSLLLKPQRICNSLLPFVGYATQRLRWSQGGPWDQTPLSRAILALYENEE